MLGLAKSAAAKEKRGSSLGEKASKDRGVPHTATGGGESYWEIRPASAHSAILRQRAAVAGPQFVKPRPAIPPQRFVAGNPL
jgi:hypothetical protein